MVIVWGSIETQEGHRDEALRLSLEHVRRSRAEPGCLRHDVHVDVENEGRLVFFEQWQDMDALRAHFAVPAAREFAARVAKLAARPPEMRIFEATPAGPPRA